MWLINNWQSIVSGIGVAAVCLMLHNCDVQRLDNNHIEDLATQRAALSEQCNVSKKITEGASNDYEKQIAAANKQLAADKLRLKTRCVMPVTRQASRPDAAQPSGQLPESNGVDTSSLLEFAGACETERLKVEGLQKFIDDSWATYDQ